MKDQKLLFSALVKVDLNGERKEKKNIYSLATFSRFLMFQKKILVITSVKEPLNLKICLQPILSY